MHNEHKTNHFPIQESKWIFCLFVFNLAVCVGEKGPHLLEEMEWDFIQTGLILQSEFGAMPHHADYLLALIL